MSQKINVRSPFYLHLTEPTIPLPTYDCSSDYADLKGFAVNNQGVVTEPSPKLGILVSYTSSASDFANGKFSTVSSDTVRTITATLRIPAGFTNTSDVFFECNATATQEGTTTTVVAPAPCTTTVTNNGSIPAQTLASGGNSVDINLASYFTAGSYPISSYVASNNNPTLAGTAISGSTLTISSNSIGGSNTIYISAIDSGTNTCNAVQSISVTVNLPAGAPNYICSTSPLTGGGIAADGTVTNPSTTGTITSHTPATSANTTASARSVTLTFSITVPVGYPNAGATITCPATFSQPAQNALEEFTCTTAGLTGQAISDNGAITKGSTSKGTISGISPSQGFNEVTSNTPRTVDFTVTIPSGYSNSGTITCQRNLKQPAPLSECGTNGFYISAGKQLAGDFCTGTFTASLPVFSTGSGITGVMGTKICRGGTPFNGKGLRYAISTFSTGAGAGIGVGDFYVAEIDSSGVVLSMELYSCKSGGNGKGGIL